MNAHSNTTTPVVPASVTRRQAFKSLASGAAMGLTGAVIVSTTSCAPTEAPAFETDPMLDAIRRYRSVDAQFSRLAMSSDDDAEVEAFLIEVVEPVRNRIAEGLPVTSPEGCRMAIETALMDRPMINGFERALLVAALTFLEGRTA